MPLFVAREHKSIGAHCAGINFKSISVRTRWQQQRTPNEIAKQLAVMADEFVYVALPALWFALCGDGWPRAASAASQP